LQQLVEKYIPQTIEDFAGIDRPKAVLSAFIKSPYTSAWLLLGPSGIGKTSIAFAAAEALGASRQLGGGIYHVPSQKCDLETIDRVVEQCHSRPMLGGPFNVVVIDEGDKMTAAAQLALLSRLDSAAPPPDTIWFVTVNDIANLPERFLSRFRKINFTTDNMLQPGVALLKKIWKAETKGKKGVSTPDFELILRTAKFNIREALMLLETELLCPGSVCEPAPAESKGITLVGKGNGAGTIYTIGCEGMAVETMGRTIKALNVHTLIDCCWKPQRAFRAGLGDSYQWAGDRLSGGRTSQDVREEGLKWLLGIVATGQNVMLMYPKESPGECNRHYVVAMSLLDRGVDVVHVFEDQLILASEYQASLDDERQYRFKKWRLPKVVGG
jgi:hypothetical protein